MTTFLPAGRRAAGFTFVLALLLLICLMSLGVALCWMANAGVVQSRSEQQILAARLQAESGLAFIVRQLHEAPLPIAGDGPPVFDAVARHLSAVLDGSPTIGGRAVTYDGNTITIPDVAVGEAGKHFRAVLSMPDKHSMLLAVTGRAGVIARSVKIAFGLDGGHPIFGFGVSSKGPICLENNIKVLGANYADEARLLSTSPGTAFRLQGDLEVDGDVYAADGNATVSVGGTGTIGGASMAGIDVMDHVHIGEGTGEFPQIDVSVFEPFATNVVNINTVTSGTRSFNNIRIAANTNPSFEGDIDINGVIYVEAPNQVTFGSGTQITGVIVTQQGIGQPRDNEIKFEMGTSSRGVEDLPDTGSFREIREMGGAFILAPGFTVKFENDSGVLNGVIAAEAVKFENAFTGTLYGGIICYGTDEFKAEDLSTFTIDHSKYPRFLAGFQVDERKLVPLPDSYLEE